MVELETDVLVVGGGLGGVAAALAAARWGRRVVLTERYAWLGGQPFRIQADLSQECGDVNLWTFRRIAARQNFVDGSYDSDITLVNWPMIDYFEELGTGDDNYIHIGASPFQIPLGALLPRRLTNLLAAGKNIGSTHITNGCYRLHPVEWNIGEAAGMLAAHCLSSGKHPEQVRGEADELRSFQQLLVADGIELAWPRVTGS